MKPVPMKARSRNTVRSGNFSTNFGKDQTVKEIKGSVNKVDIPYNQCMVNLYDLSTMALVSICTPDESGKYSFIGFNSDTKYLILALDAKRIYNAVVQDHITPTILGRVTAFNAPYDLTVTYEDSSLISRWELTSDVDRIHYYCSETPIDPAALPEPKAILKSSDRTYIDNDLIPGNTYYVCVGSVRNSVEKLSDEIAVAIVWDALWQDVIAVFNIENSNISDAKSNTWSRSSATMSTEYVDVNNGYIQSSGSSLISLGNRAVTIEVILSLDVFKAPSAVFSFVKGKESTGRVFGLRIMSHDGVNYTARLEGAVGTGTTAVAWGSFTYPVPPDEKHHLAIQIETVSSNTRLVKIFINGEIINEQVVTRTSLSCNQVTFGYTYWAGNWNFFGKVYSVRVTKGVRYTSNFASPDRFPIML